MCAYDYHYNCHWYSLYRRVPTPLCPPIDDLKFFFFSKRVRMIFFRRVYRIILVGITSSSDYNYKIIYTGLKLILFFFGF